MTQITIMLDDNEIEMIKDCAENGLDFLPHLDEWVGIFESLKQAVEQLEGK